MGNFLFALRFGLEKNSIASRDCLVEETLHPVEKHWGFVQEPRWQHWVEKELWETWEQKKKNSYWFHAGEEAILRGGNGEKTVHSIINYLIKHMYNKDIKVFIFRQFWISRSSTISNVHTEMWVEETPVHGI